MLDAAGTGDQQTRELLLSGFMFPFRGIPRWAQWFGEVVPLTHFLRIVRGIMPKGHEMAQVLPELWPMLVFLAAAGAPALKALQTDARLTPWPGYPGGQGAAS